MGFSLGHPRADLSFLAPLILGVSASVLASPVSGEDLHILGRSGAVATPPSDSPDFGTASESILLIGADSFQFLSGTEGPTDPMTSARSCAVGSCVAVATINLPSGALLTNVELEGCDGDSVGQFGFGLFQFSPPVHNGTLASSVFQSGAVSTPGCDLFPLAASRTVDNAAEKLIFDINLDAGTNLAFSAVRIRYRLQVSAAPAAATFGDVPTGHPFFQFVEALAASGITAGCGSGNYCPDQPLTRGQMAVFLSKALGLHFPN